MAVMSTTRPTVVQASWQDWLPTLPDGCADLLLTDPPYSTDLERRGCVVWRRYSAEPSRLPSTHSTKAS